LKNVLEESNEFCRVAKKKCVRHLGWEKLRRAEIDMERVRQVSLRVIFLLFLDFFCLTCILRISVTV